MLFHFPPNPDESNWFQVFLVDLVTEVLRAKSIGATPKKYKDLLPAMHAAVLRTRSGLRSRYEALNEAAKGLSVAQAQQALALVSSANYYKDVLSGVSSYRPPLGMTDEFKEGLESLFEFAFGLLGELKGLPADGLSIRDGLYSRAYHAMPGHFCPFCGIDRFDAPHPDMPRHALDHYLAISLYPIFGAHLPNLVPMCGRCNSSFKLAVDMLKADDGAARRCIDPYGGQAAKVSLLNSKPFGGGPSGQLPQWVIDFEPAIDEFETWDRVFGIRLRYKESLLDAEYEAWLGDFTKWAVDGQLAVTNNQEASAALSRWASLCPDLSDQGFLKRPMFEMLAASAQQTDAEGNRVTSLIRTLCTM